MDLSKYKALYLQEAREHLSGIEKGLLAVESGSYEPATVDALFRHYHSVKGMSASMGYAPIQKLAHAQEDLLDRVRSKKIALTPEITSTLLQCLDGLKSLITKVEEGSPLDTDIEPFLGVLKGAVEGAPPGQAQPPAPSSPQAPSAAQAANTPVKGPDLKAPTGAELKISSVMKVEGRVFDDLLAIVGDLFMGLTTFKSLSYASRSIAFKDAVFALGKSIDRLYTHILSARMLPVEDLAEALPRVVRDLSRARGKDVELKTEGLDARLDRSILENLGAPLVHIIRNSVDHGIEPPLERESSGKPPQGTISIRAYGKKDRVVVEVSDDGRGINVQRVKEKAREKGVPEERLKGMTEKEALMLVCMPGLSGAEKVTETSGRGVGMDVVKDTIEGIGGTLGIESEPGKGTRIMMELPRTTSIMKALLVRVSDDLFLIPISRIEKVIELDPATASSESLDYNGSNVPIIPLDRLIGMGKPLGRATYTAIVVDCGKEGVRSGEKRLLALRVDDFEDEIDAYIKPLVPPLSRLWGVSGITVLGDGRPVFLLDVTQIAQRALGA